MSKHTPGPWHVIERTNGQAFSIGCQVQTKGNFVTTHYIANITDGATPQAEADARLIAAAPDMLEALRELLGDFGCIVTAANHNDLATIVCVAKACQGEINELLRKVEGEK